MITIRWASAKDARILHILQQSIYDEETFFVGDKAASEYQLRQHLRQLNRRRSLYLVALVDAMVVGYLELNRMHAKKLEHSALLTIAIAKQFRQQGIGRKLLHEAYRWCEQVGVIRLELEVRVNNSHAIKLYENEGFITEGRKEKHVRLSAHTFEDSFLMVKFFKL